MDTFAASLIAVDAASANMVCTLSKNWSWHSGRMRSGDAAQSA
jgi:hypothetical protein